MAVVGGTLGLLVAHANVDLFSRFRIPGAVPGALDVRLDLRVVLFTLVVSALSALLFDSRARDEQSELVPALKSGQTYGAKRHPLFGRSALVGAQVAGSLACGRPGVAHCGEVALGSGRFSRGSSSDCQPPPRLGPVHTGPNQRLLPTAVASLGAFLPARRASRIDPNIVPKQQ